ncbi:MAG: sensor histidine kinase [Propionibacteriaceae bacterium]
MNSATPVPVDRGWALRRGQHWWVDVAVAVLVGGIGAVGKPGIGLTSAPQFSYSLIVLGCCVTLLIRRHRPRLVLTVLGAFLVAYLAVVGELGVFPAAVCVIAVYTAQTRLEPPWRWVFVVATCAGTAGGVFTSSLPLLDEDWRQRTIALALGFGVLAIAALIGVVRRDARTRYELAVDRAAILERQRDDERRLVAVEERARIAREMHDILGHSLNVVAVQAEAARYTLRTDPERADQALADIGRLSRHAVDEVRDVIDVLRSDDEEAAPTSPAPSLHDVADLVGTFANGPTPRLYLAGDTETVPSHVSLAAYRIIQESLTNAAKHAAHASVLVSATINSDSVELVVSNGAADTIVQSTGSMPGHGIAGMRERARALGGTLDAGPDPTTGGWRVAARLPWCRR